MNMKKEIVCFFAVALTWIIFSFREGAESVGKIFPEIKGLTLSDEEKSIPLDAKGKFTLIAIAYSSDAENDLNTWLNPVYNKFVAKTGMMDSEMDVNIYFIPMFSGVNIATAGTIKRRMKEEILKGAHKYVLFYKGEIAKYKKELGMEKKDTPYIFLLDKTGKIVYATSGNYTDKKLEAIEEKIE